jgi:hypothetical protein
LRGFFALNNFIYEEKQAVVGTDYKNAEYSVDNARIQLVNGVSETEAAPGSASKITTKFFGNEARKDLNNDGVEDVVFLITQQTGGSGTFFYVVAAVSEKGSFKGTQAYLLGDRIAPQTTEIKTDNTIVVNYAERAEGDAMTTPPSVGKSVYLKLDTQTLQFAEVKQDVVINPAGTYTAHLGENVQSLGVTLTPNEVLEDSRCPKDVVCIQAGTVRVKSKLTSGQGTADQIFILNKPITTEAEEITLVQVDPYPSSKKTIAKSDYVFHFEISKRAQ